MPLLRAGAVQPILCGKPLSLRERSSTICWFLCRQRFDPCQAWSLAPLFFSLFTSRILPFIRLFTGIGLPPFHGTGKQRVLVLCQLCRENPLLPGRDRASFLRSFLGGGLHCFRRQHVSVTLLPKNGSDAATAFRPSLLRNHPRGMMLKEGTSQLPRLAILFQTPLNNNVRTHTSTCTQTDTTAHARERTRVSPSPTAFAS